MVHSTRKSVLKFLREHFQRRDPHRKRKPYTVLADIEEEADEAEDSALLANETFDQSTPNGESPMTDNEWPEWSPEWSTVPSDTNEPKINVDTPEALNTFLIPRNQSYIQPTRRQFLISMPAWNADVEKTRKWLLIWFRMSGEFDSDRYVIPFLERVCFHTACPAY